MQQVQNTIMSNSSETRLSVVIPAFNEELRLPETLRHTVEYLADQRYHSEILVVNDGSTDGTEGIVAQWPESAVSLRLLNHPDRRNHGKGAAVKRGMLEGRGDFRIIMDADNSTTIEQIDRFWKFFEEGYDVVIGSRNVAGAQVVVHQALLKELAGKFGNWIIRLFAVPGISDTQAGFKMFTRRCAETVFPRLTIDRWGFDIEILAIARQHDYKILEAPIRWINAPGSKVSLKSYFQVLSEVGRIRRNVRAGVYR
jgi:dolichyl-phosphate beta-glucosyltransferase